QASTIFRGFFGRGGMRPSTYPLRMEYATSHNFPPFNSDGSHRPSRKFLTISAYAASSGSRRLTGIPDNSNLASIGRSPTYYRRVPFFTLVTLRRCFEGGVMAFAAS